MAQSRKAPAARSGSRPAGKAGSGPRASGKAAKSGQAAKASQAGQAAKGGSTARRPPNRKKSTSIVNQKQRPWGMIIAAGVVVVFAVAIVLVVVFTSGGGSSSKQASGAGSAGGQILPNTPTTGKTTVQKAATRVANKTGINGVLAWDTEGWPGDGKDHPGALEHNHVTGPVKYSILPPVGGPHNPIWMNAGVYTQPVPTERAVHNLEHGAVWITYDPNLAASKVKQLQAFVQKQSFIPESSQATQQNGQANRFMDLSPWASNSLPSPIVMSAWGYQLRLTSPTDPRMQQFVDKFRQSKTYSPEYGSAEDGIPIQTGGRAAMPGSKIANPAGKVPASQGG